MILFLLVQFCCFLFCDASINTSLISPSNITVESGLTTLFSLTQLAQLRIHPSTSFLETTQPEIKVDILSPIGGYFEITNAALSKVDEFEAWNLNGLQTLKCETTTTRVWRTTSKGKRYLRTETDKSTNCGLIVLKDREISRIESVLNQISVTFKNSGDEIYFRLLGSSAENVGIQEDDILVLYITREVSILGILIAIFLLCLCCCGCFFILKNVNSN